MSYMQYGHTAVNSGLIVGQVHILLASWLAKAGPQHNAFTRQPKYKGAALWGFCSKLDHFEQRIIFSFTKGIQKHFKSLFSLRNYFITLTLHSLEL